MNPITLLVILVVGVIAVSIGTAAYLGRISRAMKTAQKSDPPNQTEEPKKQKIIYL